MNTNNYYQSNPFQYKFNSFKSHKHDSVGFQQESWFVANEWEIGPPSAVFGKYYFVAVNETAFLTFKK